MQDSDDIAKITGPAKTGRRVCYIGDKTEAHQIDKIEHILFLGETADIDGSGTLPDNGGDTSGKGFYVEIFRKTVAASRRNDLQGGSVPEP